MHSVVIDPSFEWNGDTPPHRADGDTLIYEAHVRGLTMRHPDIPPELRGTYSGVGHQAIIEHLLALGVTAIELMPVHQFVNDASLVDNGLSNYWGYNSIGFFAPHNGYASDPVAGRQVREFKAMVRDLHSAGLEVILDVVYNHTAEGNHLGPTLAFRGIDNSEYYRLNADDPRTYLDYTGTGNSLNVRSPRSAALIMDSLRYWASEMHVDGFRFDLASRSRGSFYDVDQAVVVLRGGSPVTHAGRAAQADRRAVGRGRRRAIRSVSFRRTGPSGTGSYRDTVRAFWRGDGPARWARWASSDRYGDWVIGRLRSRLPRQLRHRSRRLHARRPLFR